MDEQKTCISFRDNEMVFYLQLLRMIIGEVIDPDCSISTMNAVHCYLHGLSYKLRKVDTYYSYWTSLLMIRSIFFF